MNRFIFQIVVVVINNVWYNNHKNYDNGFV